MFRLLLRLTTLLGCLCLGGLPLLQATDDFTPLGQGISGAHVVVDAIAATTSGGLFVGGTFTTINGTGSAALTANNVAFWSGNAWSTLGGGVNGAVSSIAVSGTIVLVGGTFTSAQQTSGTTLPCNNLVQWDTSLNAWSVVGSTPGGGCNGPITSLAYDTKLGQFWIGGTFSMVDGAAFPDLGSGNLATYNPTSLDLLPSSFAPNNTVAAIAVDTDNETAYFGGTFTPTTSPSSPNTGLLKTAAGALATLPDLGQTPVDAIAVDDGNDWIYVGGNFTFPGTTPSSSIAMFNSASSTYAGLGSGLTNFGSPGTVQAILVPTSGFVNPIVGGTFNEAGTTVVANLAIWNPITFVWSVYTGNTNGAVQVLATDSYGSVYVGGAFTAAISSGAVVDSAIVRVGPSQATAPTTTTTTTTTTGTGTGSSPTGTTSTSATGTSSGTTAMPSGGGGSGVGNSGRCGLGSSLGVLVLMALLITCRRLR